MDALDEATRAGLALFNRRYANWLELRARLEHNGLAGDDGAAVAIEAELRSAEALLMTTPAAVPGVVWRKLEVLEQTIALDDAGRPDRAEVWMLAAVKADLLAFGIGEERA